MEKVEKARARFEKPRALIIALTLYSNGESTCYSVTDTL